jgi:hypothetical protein
MSAANGIQQISSQLSLQCIARSFLNQSTTVFIGVRFVKLAMEFVTENPWVLVHSVLPALKAWLELLGYETVGSLAG